MNQQSMQHVGRENQIFSALSWQWSNTKWRGWKDKRVDRWEDIFSPAAEADFTHGAHIGVEEAPLAGAFSRNAPLIMSLWCYRVPPSLAWLFFRIHALAHVETHTLAFTAGFAVSGCCQAPRQGINCQVLASNSKMQSSLLLPLLSLWPLSQSYSFVLSALSRRPSYFVCLYTWPFSLRLCFFGFSFVLQYVRP